MTIKDIAERIYLRLPMWFTLLVEVLQYWCRLCKYNASFRTDNDLHKMQYTLLRENHVIEKGMSMKNPRKGFGQAKVTNLINRLQKYNKRYGKEDSRFLLYPLSTIKEYIRYQENDGVDVSRIKEAFDSLCEQSGYNTNDLTVSSGISLYHSTDIMNDAKGDFQSLLYSRHSIRYFKDELPSKDVIDEALTLASRTPSACNRQAWHTHVYFGKDAHDLLDMQGGCNGFSHDINCCIVVTADMKGFLNHEPFQCYIDGGLYAQNLMNSLHYLGLGTIPLSCGFLTYKLLRIQKRFGIPENEAMVAILGTGYMYDEMNIAQSTRKPFTVTNTYH